MFAPASVWFWAETRGAKESAMGWLIGEKSSTKVASVFAAEADARDAAASVTAAAHLQAAQAKVLSPADGRLSRRELFGEKVQPESRGIGKTFLRSHLVLGAIGGALGVLLWWALRAHPLIASTPLMALVALGGFGITFGMILAGVVTLRPDQSALYAQLKDSLQAGKWGVIFHPVDAAQTEAIQAALRARDAHVMSSL